jgi:hypothetical protein
MFKLAIFVLFNILLVNSIPVPPGMTEEEFDELMDKGDMGDVLLTAEEVDELNGIAPRVGLTSENKRWPNRVVPYTISSDFSKKY